jgi:hypothetical protein
MVLFVPPDTFWQDEKLHGFEKKFLETLGDALINHSNFFRVKTSQV